MKPVLCVEGGGSGWMCCLSFLTSVQSVALSMDSWGRREFLPTSWVGCYYVLTHAGGKCGLFMGGRVSYFWVIMREGPLSSYSTVG
ncbi:hypothetical protein LX36DRAFT_431223 [Colletotrichum falcatum]|nr:hypothetical protein LX36DRAFT_431223 [Colletotrichum falcatum]